MKRLSFTNKSAFHIPLIILAGFFVYANTFHVPFILDDSLNIVDNYLIRNLRAFAEPPQLWMTRYIGYLTFALNYHFHGLNLVGYHIINLIVHICTAILIYQLVTLTFQTPFIAAHRGVDKPPFPFRLVALMATLLFVVHPVQTQAVTYIVQRFTSLATMLYLCSLVLYIKARLNQSEIRKMSSRSWVYYTLSLLAAILAMKTKEIAFTLPIIILIFEYMFFDGNIIKRIRLLIPFLLTMTIIPLSMLFTNRLSSALITDINEMTRAQTAMPRFDYLFTQFRAISTYLRLLLFPVNQNLDYDYPVSTSFFTSDVFFPFLLLASLAIVGGYLLYRSSQADAEWRLVSFGIFWFFITLSVESSIIPIPDLIFEHRVYLPSAGFFIAVVTGAMLLLRRYTSHNIAESKGLAIVCSVLILAAALTAVARNMMWKDEFTLWRDAVSKSPNKARTHNFFALELARKANIDSMTYQANMEEAVHHFKQATVLRPGYAEAHFNLGHTFARMGRLNEAKYELVKSITLNNKIADAHTTLGNVLLKLGLSSEAVTEFKIAIEISPQSEQAHNNLGVTYTNLGLKFEALTEYQEAIRLKPGYIDAHFNLGNLFSALGLLDEAKKEYRTVLYLKPDFIAAQQQLNRLSGK